MRNWAGNYEYSAGGFHEPASLDELRALVARFPKVKALGTRHAFHGISDSPGELISLRHFNRLVRLDAERRSVTVEAGITYGDLCRELCRQGFALHNMASLPHICVAGAVATGTHGSGDRNANLATAVSAMQLVTAGGDVVELSRERNGDIFNGTVVALGGLGIVTRLTLDVVPAFEVRQDIYEGLPLAQLEEHFDAVVSSAYSVSLFTDWTGPTFNQVWLKSRPADGPHFDVRTLGAVLADGPRHPAAGRSAERCTVQGELGPWHERLPHFRMEHTPSVGEELQSEYMVPRKDAVAALREIDRMRDAIAPLLAISEVRTIAGDELWMSPCYRRDSVALHFTWTMQPAAVEAVLPEIEVRLAPFGARPHWGKVFTMPPGRLQSLYPRLEEFRRLLQTYDPGGKFRNAFLDKCIF